MTAEPLQFRSEEFEEDGLYIIVDAKTRLDITRSAIENYTQQFLNDPKKVPPQVKQAVDYQPCPVCPEKETAVFCHSLMPVLPFIENAEKFLSCAEVMVIYKDTVSGEATFQTRRTSAQQALKYISNLSLLYYCEVGRKYWRYFAGIGPFESVENIARRMYLNIYWLHQGRRDEIRDEIVRLKAEIKCTSECQIRRLRLICKSDAFINAFVLTEIITEFLILNPEASLEKYFSEFNR